MATIDYDTRNLRKAFEMALDSLGTSSKLALAYHLESGYGISITTGENFTQENVTYALQELLGKAATDIIISKTQRFVTGKIN